MCCSSIRGSMCSSGIRGGMGGSVPQGRRSLPGVTTPTDAVALVQPARRRLSGLPEHPRATRQQAMPHWRRSIGTGGLQDARTNLMDSLLSGRVKFVRNFP